MDQEKQILAAGQPILEWCFVDFQFLLRLPMGTELGKTLPNIFFARKNYGWEKKLSEKKLGQKNFAKKFFGNKNAGKKYFGQIFLGEI